MNFQLTCGELSGEYFFEESLIGSKEPPSNFRRALSGLFRGSFGKKYPLESHANIQYFHVKKKSKWRGIQRLSSYWWQKHQGGMVLQNAHAKDRVNFRCSALTTAVWVSLKMIFEALSSDLLSFELHSPSSITLEIPGFGLINYNKELTNEILLEMLRKLCKRSK